MSQEIILGLRRKDAKSIKEDSEFEYKPTFVTLDFVCGRGDYQNVVIDGLDLYNQPNNEYIVTENDPKVKAVLSNLNKEEEAIIHEFEKGLSEIKLNLVKSLTSKSDKKIIEYEDNIEDLEDRLKNDGLDAWYLLNNLIHLVGTAQEAANNTYEQDKEFKDNVEVVIILSY